MCGIYLTNIPFPVDVVKIKLDSILFRGPDHMGVLKIDELTFGHLRLSIIDLDSRSNQPFNFEHLTIVFNGEIYNFQIIKNELLSLGYTFNTMGDTEVLLKGFMEWGEKIVPKLNGMFAFAIYNSKTRKIFCSRDRLGVKPFFYYFDDGQFEICSQLRPLARGKRINEEAVSMYLDCSYVPSPTTIFQHVFKLPPGNNLEIDLNTLELTIKEYWNLNVVEDAGLSYNEAKDRLHDLLKDAVKIRLNSDVPFGSFLSGGIDSALVSSIAASVSENPIRTFSIGFDDKEFDESKIAKRYAEIIGSNHTETMCSYKEVLELIPEFVKVYDEPFGDSSALPSLLLNKTTKQYVTMALSGDGGDESFLGYNYFDWVSKYNILMRVPYRLRLFISNFLKFSILGSRTDVIRKIFRERSSTEFILKIFVGHTSILQKRNLDWTSRYASFESLSKNLLQRSADLNIKLWLENDSNTKVDRASMAFAVEVRSPFLDYRVLEFARSIPVSYRYFFGTKKRILRDILAEYIPKNIFNHPKKGFAVPLAAWIREELRMEFIENLSDDFLNQVPNLNVPLFQKMFKEHLDGKADYSTFVWRLYVLSKWYQEFGFYKKQNVL